MVNKQPLTLDRKQLAVLFAGNQLQQQAVIAFDNLFKSLTATDYYCYQAANFNLTSTTAFQQAFDVTPFGALNLEAGEYVFEWLQFLDGMSATSGNAQLSLLGAGTAVLAATEKFMTLAADVAQNTLAGPSMAHASAVAASPAPIATASAATSLVAFLKGAFTITTAGSIIPSIALATAIAAISAKGSFFKVTAINNANSIGPWT